MNHRNPWLLGFIIATASFVAYLYNTWYSKYLQSARGFDGKPLTGFRERDSEGFARALGIDDFKYKLLAFTISAAFAGLAGALYAHYTTVVTPKILGNEFFLMAMVMLAVGGMGRFPGVLIGAFIVIIGNELLRSFDNYRLIVLGVVVVATVLLLPNGLVSLAGRLGWREAGGNAPRTRPGTKTNAAG